jgi:hypothetical protein
MIAGDPVAAASLGPLVERGRITRHELFELEDVDAGLARFAELRPDPLRIQPNAATRPTEEHDEDPCRRASGAPPDVCGEQLMDERLIADARASRLCAQGPQDVGVETNRDQLASRTPERRPADSPRASQLLVGQLRDVREVNRLGSRTPLSLYDSPPAR